MSEISIMLKVYDLFKSIIQITSKLDKNWRYSIGISTDNCVLELMELLTMAKYAPKAMKGTYLLKAQAKLDILKLRLRLMLDLKIADETNLFKNQEILVEIGRMLGGWYKSLNK